MKLTMNMENEQSKVYLGIVQDIKKIILTDGLKQGDKIPSERELSERLKVGRSSVREALRALELLGLIETRRGEGTFLSDFKNHQLIKLLGMFILEDPLVQEDLDDTKRILEKELYLSIRSLSDKSGIKALRDHINEQGPVELEHVLRLSNNRLLFRIWEVLNSYSTKTQQPDNIVDQKYIEALLTEN
ncbi:DNA-binding FadR family transcriptional regulator [Lederbergia galactosidilyticus]|nr:DNA-binding FadR family transcriptional regulator [Lederbergia galactosidilytica]